MSQRPRTQARSNSEKHLPSGRLSDPGPDFGLARTATPLVGGLPRPRLTPGSATGDGGESAAAVDSMTADATADAALTGLVSTL